MFIWCIFLCAAYLSFYYVKEYSKRWNNKTPPPPGPIPLPFLGTLIQIARAAPFPHLAFPVLAKRYGDIYSVKFGRHDYVILSSIDAIIDVWNKDDALGRPLHGPIGERNGDSVVGVGLIYSEGEFWSKKRAWTVKNLRIHGFGKTATIDSATKDQVKLLLDQWEQQCGLGDGGGILQVHNAFAVTAAKIMWTMTVGGMNDEDEAIMMKLLEKSDAMVEKGTYGPGLMMVAPFLKYVAPGLTGYNVLKDFMDYGRKVASNYLRELSTEEDTESFIRAYAKEMETDMMNTNFFERDFQMLFLDIFQAGAETSSSYLEMVVLYLVLHPDVQEKVFQEISTVISHQEPSHEDMDMMPYTQATLLEVHRLGKVVPNLVPRKVLNDFEYRGFHFKKGTGLLADLHSALHTEEFGGETDSWNFRPERFISHDGQLNSLSKRLVHFSVGKRNCPGNRVAEVSSFLIIVSILQRFKLTLVYGDEAPCTEMQFGFTGRPQPFRFCISNRA